jgi:hypothetical protein
VVVLPSAHYVDRRGRVAHYVAKVAWAVPCRTDHPILLAARSPTPDSTHWWIEPGEPIEGLEGLSIRAIDRFVNQTSRELAGALFRRRALVETQVMVGNVRRLVSLGQRHLPALVGALETVGSLMRWEDSSVGQAMYRRLPTVEVSDVIPSWNERFGVLPLPDVLSGDAVLPLTHAVAA